jgi:hypothetical protein
MSLTVNHVIQLLQVIILVITAVIYISQLVLRFTIDSDDVEIIDMEEDTSKISSFVENFRSMLASVALFFLSGGILAFYLVFLSVPGEINTYMTFFQQNFIWITLILVISILLVALIIGNVDAENVGAVKAIPTAVLFFSGALSFFAIIAYICLWALTYSPERLFFIGMLIFAVGLFAFLFGAWQIGVELLDSLEDWENRLGD